MEQRLFIAACLMYLFAWVSRRLFRKNKLDKPSAFGIWHAGFLLLILGCAYYIFSFIMNMRIYEFIIYFTNHSLSDCYTSSINPKHYKTKL